jgi:hypothetical protein
MSTRHLAALAVLLALAPAATASDPVGVYAVIDKVVLEPGSGAARRIQVWGTFARAVKGNGEEYTAPEHGYMYFSLPPDKQDLCRKEWTDLKKLAGTKQCVAFGSRYKPTGTVRKKDDPAKEPDVYPVGFGLTKVGADNYEARKLLEKTKSPDKGSDGKRP